MKKLRICNLYCGIGGNIKLWGDKHEVTAIENVPEIAELYKQFFPKDKVIITDAHKYLLEHYKEFDFIWSSPPCFISSELVLTMRGHIQIKDIRVGDKVLTHKGRWRKVKNIGRKKINVIREIKGIGVDSIKCTQNHPFYVKNNLNDKKNYWCDAKSIKGKYWCSPTIIKPIEKYCILDPYIIGRWLGDGWLRKKEGKKQVFICCGKHEKIPQLKTWIKSEERTTYKYSLSDKNIVDFLYTNFKDKENKFLPGWVFGESKKFRQNLLKGYLDADGYFEKKRKRFVSTSISRNLTYAMGLLAQTLGYRYNISRPKFSKKYIIEGREVNQRQPYILAIKKLNEGRPRQYLLEDNREYSKVKSNKSLGWNAFVYNIQVEEDESYTINNKIVHNCPSHSKVRFINQEQNKPIYPEMSLYQEILFLKHYFKGKWVVENVNPFYEPLVKAQKVGRHLFWANFIIPGKEFPTESHSSSIANKIAKKKGIDPNFKIKNKVKIIRNAVQPELGLHVFRMAFKEKQTQL